MSKKAKHRLKQKFQSENKPIHSEMELYDFISKVAHPENWKGISENQKVFSALNSWFLYYIVQDKEKSVPRSRIGLSQYNDEYVLCYGWATDYNKERNQLLLLNPGILATGFLTKEHAIKESQKIVTASGYLADDEVETINNKDRFNHPNLLSRGKSIDSHIWLNINEINPSINNDTQLLLCGELVYFVAKVHTYKGIIAKDKAKKVQKYGLTDTTFVDFRVENTIGGYSRIQTQFKTIKKKLLLLKSTKLGYEGNESYDPSNLQSYIDRFSDVKSESKEEEEKRWPAAKFFSRLTLAWDMLPETRGYIRNSVYGPALERREEYLNADDRKNKRRTRR